MKKYHPISKIGILICFIAIIMTIVNWFTGFINHNIMNNGSSVVCLMGFYSSMVSINWLEERRKDSR